MKDSIRKLFAEANKYLAQKQWQNCINVLTKIIDSSKATKYEKADAYTNRGRMYFEKSIKNDEKEQYIEAKANYTDAIADYKEAIALYQEDNNKAIPYFCKGNVYFALQKYDNAITDYTKAIALYPKKNDQADAYFKRGNAYKQLKQYEEAIDDYKEAIALYLEKNDKANAYFNRGNAYNELKEYEKARNDYTEAITRFTDDNDKADAYTSRGNSYDELKQYKEAIADYKEAIALATNKNTEANAYFGKGNVYFALQKYEDAIADYKKAIDLYPEKNDKANAYYNRGSAYHNLKKYKEAKKDYQKSVDLICEYSSANYGEKKTFYKFRPLNKHTFNMLKKQQIYFSDIASLNDPLECPFVREDQFFRDIVFAEGTDYEPRIFSLVLPCDKQEKLPVKNYLLFFSHYAAAHTGICIEYKINKKFLHENMFYEQVSYQETERLESIPDLFAVKNTQWEYEHEARFVAFGKKRTYSTETSVTIKKIFFGLNTSKQNKKRLYKIMKKQKNIEFFEARETGEALLNIDFVEYLPQENQK